MVLISQFSNRYVLPHFRNRYLVIPSIQGGFVLPFSNMYFMFESKMVNKSPILYNSDILPGETSFL